MSRASSAKRSRWYRSLSALSCTSASTSAAWMSPQHGSWPDTAGSSSPASASASAPVTPAQPPRLPPSTHAPVRSVPDPGCSTGPDDIACQPDGDSDLAVARAGARQASRHTPAAAPGRTHRAPPRTRPTHHARLQQRPTTTGRPADSHQPHTSLITRTCRLDVAPVAGCPAAPGTGQRGDTPPQWTTPHPVGRSGPPAAAPPTGPVADPPDTPPATAAAPAGEPRKTPNQLEDPPDSMGVSGSLWARR